MPNQRPSEAEVKLWVARVKAENRKGNSLEDTSTIVHQMIDAWKAVRENAVDEVKSRK